MASVLEFLHTTNYSKDLGTTAEEHFCVTSTPIKCLRDEFHQRTRDLINVSDITTPRVTKCPLGPPPPLPTTPKPVTAITKMRIEDMSVSVTRKTEVRPRDMSYKRQAIRRQRSTIGANSSGRSQDSSTSSEQELSFKRTRFTSGDNLISQSESSLGRFSRNSEMRRAKVWKGSRIPMSVSAVGLCHLSSKPELLLAVKEEVSTPTPVEITQKLNQKVHKPCKQPGFRLKKLIQIFKVFI